MRVSYALWPLAAAPAVANAATTTAATLPTATVAQGVVVGTTTALANAPLVNKFLGMPFAKSPPQRFSPPNAPLNFTGSYNATALKPACIQEFVGTPAAQQFTEGLFNSPPPIDGQSEDCLYINVFAPSTPAPASGRAVLFWLFGGGYAFGTGSLHAYDGSAFAAYEDVIVVTHNYRTNVFGFSNSPQIPVGQQNAGYLDQRMALEWVQQNIAAFGGDPGKVTIFGQSAGGWSVDNLIATYTNTTAPFRAGILESGQLTYLAQPIAFNSTPAWNTLISLLNCTTSNALVCARNAPVRTIVQIIQNNTLNFYPTVDNVTRSYSPAIRRESGQFAAVPILIGNNADEGRIFEYGQTNLTAFLDSSLNVTAPQLIPKITKAYPTGNISDPIAGGNSPYDVISDLGTYLGFQCGTCLLANLTAHLDVPVWQYYYNTTFPNLAALNDTFGVYHSSEIPIVWGTYPGGPVNPVSSGPVGLLPNNLPPTANETALSQYLMGVWAGFAKDPYAGPAWARSGTGYKQGEVAILGGAGNSTGATLVSGSVVRSPCQLLLPAFTYLTGPAYGLPNYSGS